MFNLSRVVSLSLGIIFLMILPLFLGFIHFDYIALENFIFRLSESKLIGYSVPELLGSKSADTIQQKIKRLEDVFVGILAFYGCILIFISFLNSSTARSKIIYFSVGGPILFIFYGFWFKFINDDHIISGYEKKQLFQFTLVSMFFLGACFYFGLKKKPVKKKKNAHKIPIRSALEREENQDNSTSTDKSLGQENQFSLEEPDPVSGIPSPDEIEKTAPSLPGLTLPQVDSKQEIEGLSNDSSETPANAIEKSEFSEDGSSSVDTDVTVEEVDLLPKLNKIHESENLNETNYQGETSVTNEPKLSTENLDPEQQSEENTTK